MVVSCLIVTGLLSAIAWVLWRGRGAESLRDEERDLREFWRRKDAAERRGEPYPPRSKPGPKL